MARSFAPDSERDSKLDEILRAAGFRAGRLQAAAVLVVVAVLVVGLLVLYHLAVESAGIAALGLLAAYWAAWLLWLSVVFVRSRQATEGEGSPLAYRRALIRHIIPGFSVITAITLVPATFGVRTHGRFELSSAVVSDSPWRLAGGVALMALGLWIAGAALQAIGLAAAAFVEEYRQPPPGQRAVGIYAVVRHPICVGGMMAMAGLAVLLASARLDLVAWNIAMTGPYGVLEDVRLRGIPGHDNEAYRRSVRRFVPTLNTLAGHCRGRVRAGRAVDLGAQTSARGRRVSARERARARR